MKNNLKRELAKAKIEKAREAWEKALWCFQGNKFPATVNRIYYSMYRACLALLVFEQRVLTKHTAVLVNQKFVKENLLSKKIGRYLHEIQTIENTCSPAKVSSCYLPNSALIFFLKNLCIKQLNSCFFIMKDTAGLCPNYLS